MRNFEKMTKRVNRSDAAIATYKEAYSGRKLNKVKRDRSHKRNWEGQ